jgi:subtilisin family serine protease
MIIICIILIIILKYNYITANNQKKYICVLVSTSDEQDFSGIVANVQFQNDNETNIDFFAEVTTIIPSLKMFIINNPSDLAIQYVRDNDDVYELQEDIKISVNSYSWGLDRIDQLNRPLDNNQYNPPNNGKDVNIYIVDTGIDTNHYEFSNSNRIVSNIYNSYGDITSNIDVHGHGTHVAGTIAGRSIGVAYLSNLYGMKVLDDQGSGWSSDIILALSEILKIKEQYPRISMIISMSLGGVCYPNCANNAVNVAVNHLTNSGIIVTVAAGNNQEDSCKYFPASSDTAISVGAVSFNNDNFAIFSNYGTCIDILAPGTSILSSCNSMNPNINRCLRDSNTGALYSYKQGTSK